MAVIGEMRQLTIGGKTYTIPTYSLPIASSSVLGGIKVGSGLSIDPSTGTLTATGTSITIDTAMSDSSTNAVQNKVIKSYADGLIAALDGGTIGTPGAGKTLTALSQTNGQVSATFSNISITKSQVSDFPTKVSAFTNDAGYTTNTGTVTSVRVQATSPVQSSTSTAQSATLNTTISLADAYGDTKNPYGSKTKNYVLAAPSSAAGAPTFRALVAADIPDLSSVYLTSYTETDPTVPSWAKASSKPSYTFSEIGSKPTTISGYGITNAYTKTEVDTLISNLPEPMIFKGSLGTGGTITSLPTAAATNEGFTYKVITAGTYASQSAKVGDTFISDGLTWILIPSGDEPSGTVTSITLTQGSGITISNSGTAITTSGTRTISHGDTSSQASSSNSGRTYIQSITLDDYGHVTGLSTASETVTNTDTKLQVAAVTSGTTYYPIVGTGTTAATRQYDTTGLIYVGTNGTTSAVGSAKLTLGNSTASGTANNKQGQLVLYGSTAYAHTIQGAPTAARTLTLPDKTGTIALTSDIPTVSYPVTSVNSKTGAVSLTASDVGALASSTTYVSTVTTTAGTHTTISSKSGAVSFNVPTKTSHLTNDSGFTTNTGTVTSVAVAGATNSGITISGSPITTSGTITVGLNLSTAINGLGEGTSPAQLNDYAVVQYAGGGTTTTTYHRRKLSNLIVGKAVADQNGATIDTTYLKLAGGTITGPVTFGDTVSIDEATVGDLIVNGASRLIGDTFTNKIQITTVNAPTTSGGSTYGPGSSGQVLKTNGTSIYWDSAGGAGTVTQVTAGTGLKIGTASSGGTITTTGTINHINSVTAQTTQAVYPIKIDAQGHISAYGSAVTIVNTRGTATSGGTTLSVVNTGDMYTWNNKSDTDEKVKQESLNGTNSGRNILLTPSLGTTGTITNSVAYARYMTYNDYSQELSIQNSSDSTKKTTISGISISIKDGTYSTAIRANTPSAYRNIYLPDKNGTFALTTDIPTNISSFTNDVGYISSSTTSKIFTQASAPTSGMVTGDIWIDTSGL